MGLPTYNIDEVSDDTLFSVVEAIAVASTIFESKAPGTLLVINLSGDAGDDAILGGEVNAESLERISALLDEIKARALEDDSNDPANLYHLEKPLVAANHP